MIVREVILDYWKSWQSHSNWEETRNLMHDDFKMDAGFFKTETADQLIELMKKGNPWKDIQLLDLVIDQNKGALFYEGIDSVTQAKVRIAEIITVKEGKVSSCLSSISSLSQKE